MNSGKIDTSNNNISKQIIYPKFISRIFSLMIDFLLLSCVTSPITAFISKIVFIYIFSSFLGQYNIDTSNHEAVAEILKSEYFAEYLRGNYKFLEYLAIMFFLNFIVMMAYFIFFWSKFGATPGKMMMNMRIVNVSDYSRPSIFQYIKRFLGYSLFLPSVFSIMLNKQNRALHDKISGTLVIKK